MSVILNANNARHAFCATKVPLHGSVCSTPSTRSSQGAQSSEEFCTGAPFPPVPVKRTSLPRHSPVLGVHFQSPIGLRALFHDTAQKRLIFRLPLRSSRLSSAQNRLAVILEEVVANRNNQNRLFPQRSRLATLHPVQIIEH